MPPRRPAARTLLDAGADGIKLYAAIWAPPIVSLSNEVIRATVEEARRRAFGAVRYTVRDGCVIYRASR